MIGPFLIDLHLQFSALQSGLATLVPALRDNDRPWWTPPLEESSAGGKAGAVRALTRLFHLDDQDPPLVPTGLLYLPAEHKPTVDAINVAKQGFKDNVVALRKATGAGSQGLETVMARAGQQARDPAVAEALDALHLSRLHLLWCYRQLVVLPPRLDSVSFSWVHQRAIQRISVEQALTMAQELRSERHRGEALADLEAIGNRPLAVAKPVAPHLRANLAYEDEQGVLRRRMITASNVLLFQDEHLPRIRWPGSAPQTASPRLPRRDRRLATSPVSPHLPVYCYE